MLILYTIAIFVGAALLFMVQPMVAKMLLPKLGGTPAVWNTCMVFFQAALLGGYLYAHLLSTYLRPRAAALVHSVVLIVPALVLLTVGMTGIGTAPGDSPIAWLLLVLTTGIGLPFLIVATGGPLLQRWFAATGHQAAKDPYFLYAASNAGSLIALLSYPVIIEPLVSLAGQRQLWTVGYFLFAGLTIACALTLTRRPEARTVSAEAPATAPVAWATRLRWIAFAFVPSSLMLGVTTYISIDLAAVPLLWVVPLSLYLLTFIFAFSNASFLPPRIAGYVLPFLVLASAVVFQLEATDPIVVIIGLHLATFFVAAMLCHGRLAAERPDPAHLTEFYLLIAVGGVLGGAFNGLLAPVAFTNLVEYPLVLVAACFVRPLVVPAAAPKQNARLAVSRTRTSRILDFVLPLALVVVVLAADQLVRLANSDPQYVPSTADPTELETQLVHTLRGVFLGLPWPMVANFLTIGIPTVVCLVFIRRQVRFALGVLVLMGTVFYLYPGPGTRLVVTQLGMEIKILHHARSFFGVHWVTTAEPYKPAPPNVRQPTGRAHMLSHGNTLHGVQGFDSADPVMSAKLEAEPRSYFSRPGPLGRIMGVYDSTPLFDRIAVIGLGAGSTAAYARTDQAIDYYEIDPEVQRIAEDSRLFTFLANARKKAKVQVILGDGRLEIAAAPDGAYGMIAVDAFSSDAIPVHLITRDAVEIYMSKLTSGGILAFHVSNRYLDLTPVLGAIARDLGLAGYEFYEDAGASTSPEAAKARADQAHRAARWVVLARQQADVQTLISSGEWSDIAGRALRHAWTDDYSNILGVFTLWRRP